MICLGLGGGFPLLFPDAVHVLLADEPDAASSADLDSQGGYPTSSYSRVNRSASAAGAGCCSPDPQQQVNVIVHTINVSSRLPICNQK